VNWARPRATVRPAQTDSAHATVQPVEPPRASCPPGIHVLPLRSLPTLICCLNVEGRSQAPFHPALLCCTAMLQRHALPRQPPPVRLRQGDLLEHRPNLGLLPEPSAAARSQPQAILRHRFYRQEHLSMDRLVQSSSNPTDTITSSARVL
jgi:hypothetical protein